MSRLSSFLGAALWLLGACGQSGKVSDWADAGLPCVDLDGDGFGVNCALGRDCDDRDRSSTNECRVCAHPEPGCGCAIGQPPIPCFLPDEQLADGGVMCHEGTRVCRDGLWGQCQDVASYQAIPQEQPRSTALVVAGAAPQNCSTCDVNCYQITDNLLAMDGGVGDGGLQYGAGGGLQLGTLDAGVIVDSGTDAGGTGCAALQPCCESLGAPTSPARTACAKVVSDANASACTGALKFYCPSVISGPFNGCTPGNAIDGDCDGIPDAVDECTASTVASNPDCNGLLRPLSSTNNQAIFEVLDKGESATNSLEIAFQVRNADVYYLFDTSGSMRDERDNLISSMQTGNVVECALLKNCCDTLSGTAKTNCTAKVTADNQANCKSSQATYCAGKTQLLDCPDLDLDGSPDNALKTQGVLGATRCLVGNSWFGTGSFLEIPFRDGKSLIGHKIDNYGIRDRGNIDEWAFRHYVDMTPDIAVVEQAISSYKTSTNYDSPEATMVALNTLLNGKGLMFGNRSVSVPERLGAGCPAGTFGYGCFRSSAVPIVLLFTDYSAHNGPESPAGTPVYTPPSGYAPALYDASYTLNGKAPSSGAARFVPRQAETFGTAYDLGDVRDKFVIASGDLRQMTGNYPASVTGCNAEDGAPDAVMRFQVSPGANTSVKFVANVFRDTVMAPWHPSHPWYSRYDTSDDSVSDWATIGYEDVPDDPPSPATQWPVVMTLYRGSDASTRVGCQTVCPSFQPAGSCRKATTSCSSHGQCCSGNCTSGKCVGPDPYISQFNICRPATDVCTASSQCCSGTCTSGKCVGPDPAGTQACLSTELTSDGFTQTLAPDTYFVTIKARRAADKGFFELQVGDPAKGSTTTTTYTPPKWTEVRKTILDSGAKVLPIFSCNLNDEDAKDREACVNSAKQLRAVSQLSGAVDASGQGLLQYINPDGTGLGSGLALAVRDLATSLAMNVTLGASDNPGFGVDVQKCTNSSDAAQAAVCKAYSTGCTDTSPLPKNTVAQCKPGAIPKFAVKITNPLPPGNVPPNPDDPYGGYHFTLDLTGNQKYLLARFPVYIIPNEDNGVPPPIPGAYSKSGVYEQVMVADGCRYYLSEGEAPGLTSCTDGIDNNGDGLVDQGIRVNDDIDYDDDGEFPPDPGCLPGSCIDDVDNDGDGQPDLFDANCATTAVQDWTNLFFKADMPAGTSINFDMCTADSSLGLATCSYTRIATVTSSAVGCRSNVDCKGIVSEGVTRDGFCGNGAQCQFVTPVKREEYCTSDAMCPQGAYKDFLIESHCDMTQSQCVYTTPPAEVGSALGTQNGKAFAKIRIELRSNADASATPVLNTWNLEYNCRSAY